MKNERKQFFVKLKQKKINFKILIPICAFIVLVFVFVGCRVIPSLLANNVYSITDAGGNIDSLNPGDIINYNINGYSKWRILTVDKENGTVEVTSDSNVYNLTIDPTKSDEEINAIYQAEASKFADDRYVINSRTISKADSLLFDTKGEYWLSNINEDTLMTNKTGDQETTRILRDNFVIDKIYVFPYIEFDVRPNEVPARGTIREYPLNGINTWVYTGNYSYLGSSTRRLKYISMYPVGLDVSDIQDIENVVSGYYNSFDHSGTTGYGNGSYYDYYNAFSSRLTHITNNQDYFNGNDSIFFFNESFSGNYYSNNDKTCQEKKYYYECKGVSIGMINFKGSITNYGSISHKPKILTFGYRPVLTLRITDVTVGKSNGESLRIGDNVKYEANGYRNWKVLSINKSAGTVDVISGGIVKNISLYGKEDYENYEEILQNEVNSYINGDIAIRARAVKEEDITTLNKINDAVSGMYWYNKKNVAVNRGSTFNKNETSSSSSYNSNSYEVGIIWTGTGDYYVNDIINSVSSSNINKYWVQFFTDGGNYNTFYYIGRGNLNFIAGLRPIVTLKYDSVKKLSNVQARKLDKSSQDYDNYYTTEQLANNQSEGVSSLLFRDAGKELDKNNSVNNNIYNNNSVNPEYGTVRVDVGETGNVLNLAVTLAIIYGLIIGVLGLFISIYRKNLINKQ